MLTCVRRSRVLIHHSARFASSSTDLSALLQEQSLHFEEKPIKTIAFETFVQTPAEFVSNTLVYIHDTVPLPWWATIVTASFAFRFVVGASVAISQQRLMDRLHGVRENVSKELEPKIKYLNMQAMRGKTATIVQEQANLTREAKLLTKRAYVDQNVHPGKLLILSLFGSIPWMYFTFGIRMVCLSPMTSPLMSHEGLFWFENLTEVDPYGILPLGFLLPSLIGISFNAIEKPGAQNPRLITMARIQRGITRAVIIGFSLIALKLPSGIVLFWTLNSSLQLAQTLIFELPKFRQMMGFQPSRFGSEPIKTRWQLWKNKWSLFFRTLKWYSKLSK